MLKSEYNKIFQILFIIPVLFFITGCDIPCGQKHTLDSVYKIKYKVGDTLIYESGTNLLYFYISVLESGFIPHSQEGMNDVGCDAYYEYEIIGICPVNELACIDTFDQDLYLGGNCVSCEKCFNICKRMSTRPVSRFSKRLEDPLLSFSNDWSERLGNYVSYDSSLVLNNKEFMRCYTFENINDSITSLYYNHSYGLIGFELDDSVDFVLIK